MNWKKIKLFLAVWSTVFFVSVVGSASATFMIFLGAKTYQLGIVGWFDDALVIIGLLLWFVSSFVAGVLGGVVKRVGELK